MKKLLTIMVLALALCLVCGVALADKVYSYDMGDADSLIGDTVDGIVVKSHDAAAVATSVGKNSASNHMVYRAVRLYAADGENFTTVTMLFNDHVWDHNKAAKVTDPTCAAKGYTTHYCDFCDETTVDTWVDNAATLAAHAANHIKKTTKEATCSEDGTAVDYCKTCKVEFGNTYTIDRKVDDHVWVWKAVTLPTCKADGTYEWACLNCGINYHVWKGEGYKDFKLTRALYTGTPVFNAPAGYDGHDWSEWIPEKAATCLKGSTKIRYCNICDATQENEADDKLAAVWEVKDPAKLNNCLLGPGDEAEIKWVCKLCDGKAPGHEKNSYSINADGRVYAPDQQTAVKLKHSYVLVDAAENFLAADWDAVANAPKIYPATCTKGAYKQYKCKNSNAHECFKVYVSEPNGHKYTEWQLVAAPTATTKGIWNRSCKVCGDTATHISFNPPSSLCAEHTPVLDEEWSIEPDCELPGYNFYICAVCGIDLDDLTEEVPALGHDWDVTVKKAATCTEEGLNNRVCKRCGIGETDVKVDKLPHDYDEGKITKEATLTEKGEKTFTCKACGATKTEEVDFVPAEPANYEMTAEYDGKTVSGKLVHDPTTVKADEKFVRVTFYVEGNYYMATMAEVNEDGTFSVDGVGPIVYITVAASTNSAVNPEAYEAIATPIEIEVK